MLGLRFALFPIVVAGDLVLISQAPIIRFEDLRVPGQRRRIGGEAVFQQGDDQPEGDRVGDDEDSRLASPVQAREEGPQPSGDGAVLDAGTVVAVAAGRLGVRRVSPARN